MTQPMAQQDVTADSHDDLDPTRAGAVPLDRVDDGVMVPRLHSQAMRAEALRLLAGGLTPGEVCKTLEVPRGTLGWWKRSSESFAMAYAHAIRSGADHLAADTVEIADAVPASKEEVNRARLQVQARQWLAARYDPEAYGDRVQHEVTGEVAIRRTRFRSLLGERSVVDASFDVSEGEPGADGRLEPDGTGRSSAKGGEDAREGRPEAGGTPGSVAPAESRSSSSKDTPPPPPTP